MLRNALTFLQMMNIYHKNMIYIDIFCKKIFLQPLTFVRKNSLQKNKNKSFKINNVRNFVIFVRTCKNFFLQN